MQLDAKALDTGAVDAIAERFAARGGQPGLAYGVVADGRLAHSGGSGERRAGGAVPDAGTVFRIASMTKSFTATMIVLLRDRGALGLDDPAARYVPELAGLRLAGGRLPAAQHQAPADDDGRLPDRRPVGRPAAEPRPGRVRRAAGQRSGPAGLGARHGLRLLQSRLRHSRPRHRGRHRRRLRQRHPRAGAGPARPEQHRLPRIRVRPGRAHRRLPARRRYLAGAGAGRPWRVRPDGRHLQLCR